MRLRIAGLLADPERAVIRGNQRLLGLEPVRSCGEDEPRLIRAEDDPEVRRSRIVRAVVTDDRLQFRRRLGELARRCFCADIPLTTVPKQRNAVH
jgi:hypothetical protein